MSDRDLPNLHRTPLVLNWFGMGVHDVLAASDFYGGTLGFAFQQGEEDGPWRKFHTRGMTFELFQAHPNRLEAKGWGMGQAFRPVLLIHNLADADGNTVQIVQYGRPEGTEDS